MNQKTLRKNTGKKETKKVYSVTLPPTLVKLLDETRNDWGISRSTSIQLAVNKLLNPEKYSNIEIRKKDSFIRRTKPQTAKKGAIL
jgi:metal-responsive CopG/Arc/MetJ family transcriptional regulator